MRLTITLFSCFLFSFSLAQETKTLILTPTQDAYFIGSRGVNGDDLRAKAGKQTTAIKFNISDLEIVSAQLELTNITGSVSDEVVVYEGDSYEWNENDLSIKPNRLNDIIIGNYDETESNPGEGVYIWTISVGNIEAADSLTLLVLRTSGSRYTSFHSKEDMNGIHSPRLILEVSENNNGGDDNGGSDGDDNTDGGNDDGDDNSGDNNDGNNDDNDNSGGDGNTISVWKEKSDGTLYYNGGNVGIGTERPITKLAVDGEIRATKVRVRGDVNIPDYVFEEDYKLKTIEEVDAYIKANKHLPEVPSAKEIEANGLSLGDMDATLLKKIEELTLYIIELKKEIEVLKAKQEKN